MSGWRKSIATISLAKMKLDVKKGPMSDIGHFSSRNGSSLEREEGVVKLHAVTWLLDTGEVAPAAIRNAGLGDLLIGHRICGGDILWANDAVMTCPPKPGPGGMLVLGRWRGGQDATEATYRGTDHQQAA